MPDVAASYGRLFDFFCFFGVFSYIIDENSFLGIFIHNWWEFVSEVLYLQQTFIEYVSD